MIRRQQRGGHFRRRRLGADELGRPEAWPVAPAADPGRADPRIEVDGAVVAGGEVGLRFSVADGWLAYPVWDASWPGAFLRWYVDDGVLVNNGRTEAAGIDDAGRPYGENRLRIPAGYHGPMRVAVVLGTYPPAWTVTTLEIP